MAYNLKAKQFHLAIKSYLANSATSGMLLLRLEVPEIMFVTY